MKLSRLTPATLIVAIILAIKPIITRAVCPVCTIAVASGVGLSRYLGIDDIITGLWIGGLIVSMIMWTIGWLQKKHISFPGRNIIIILAYIALVVLPLYFSGFFSHEASCVCGINKLLLGIINGTLGFWTGAEWYTYLKIHHGNKAYFPFQKVVMPLLPLVILSLLFAQLIK